MSLIAGSLVWPATLAGQAHGIENLARELSALRSEVEQLSDRLASEKADSQDALRAFARQKAELALELDRERMRLQKTRMAIAEKRKLAAQEQASAEALIPVFHETSAALRRYIESSLPFRVPERLAELDKLEAQLRSGLMTPEQAIARLWTSIEDEQRMTRDSGVFRQTITLDGVDQLADVVRLGMVTMYFKTSDGVVGHAQRTHDGWGYAVLSASEDLARVDALFESFKKQIRVGYFELPNALQVKP